MATFAGLDANGDSFVFEVDGSATAAILASAVQQRIPTAVDHEAGSVSTTPEALDGSTGKAAAGYFHVRIDNRDATNSLWYTLDGGTTTPSATDGEVIPPAGAAEIALLDLANVRIRSSAGTVVYSQTYRKYI